MKPEENKPEDQLKEGWVEVDLGDAGKSTTSNVTEEVVPDSTKSPDTPEAQKPDESRFQKRINKLTREREEAREQAALIIRENEALKARLEEAAKSTAETMDTATSKYLEGVEAKITAAQKKYEDAFDAGDKTALVAAQMELGNLQFERNAIKLAPKAEAPKKPEPKPKPKAQEVPDLPDATKVWLNDNPWFGTGEGKDVRATQMAVHISDDLISEGMDPTDPDFYEEVEKRLLEDMPRAKSLLKGKSRGETRRNPDPVAGQSRITPKGSNKVILTHEDQATAKRMGVSNEAYARSKKLIDEVGDDYVPIDISAGRK